MSRGIKGHLYVVSGPSGAGKSTICRLVRKMLGINLATSATTRAPREGEMNGRDYYFLTKEEFIAKEKNGEFLEYATVHGNYYGTLKLPFMQDKFSSVTSYESHTSWYTAMYDAVCDSSKYESGWVWNNSSSGIVNSGDKWYYIAETDEWNSVLMSTEDFISGTAVDSFNSTYYEHGSSSSYYPGYYGGLTAAGTTLYYSSPSDIRFYDTVTGETEALGIDSDISVSSCRYDGNGILSVFFSKKPNNYDDSGSKEITIFNAGDPDGDGIVTSSDLVSVQKYLLTGLLDINWAVYDVTGNIGVDILDFIRIKKLSAR